MNNARDKLKLRITQSLIMVFTVMLIIFTVFSATAFSGTGDAGQVTSPQEKNKDIETTKAEEMKFAFIAAAVAFGLGAIGAGMAISHVGAAAMGAVAEKPEIAGQALIFVGLAEGIVVFGFITAIMIILKV